MTIQTDFDRIAALPHGVWDHNNHYHKFLLRYVPRNCEAALDVGCGQGEFARLLAERSRAVLAIDLSPEMIRVGQSGSSLNPNLEFRVADLMSCEIPIASFDCVASIATLHHLPLREAILKMKASLKSGGVMLMLDIFEPERSLLKLEGLVAGLLHVPAMAASASLRLLHNRRLHASREARAAWREHARHDAYPKLSEVRDLCAQVLPGALITKHLLWRYSVIWRKPAC